jgi:hypothetical protein
VEAEELAKQILDQDGWSLLDNNPDEKKKLFANKERLEKAQLFFHCFNSVDGRRALEVMVKDFLTKPMANPNDDLLTIGIREGQARMVKWILAQIEIAKKGK